MQPRLAYSLLIAFIAVGLFVGFSVLKKPDVVCSQQYSKDGQVKVGNKVIDVQIPKTEEQKQKGLGGKQCLAENQGMLFKFDTRGYYPFWMKDMKFPIDIVWVDYNHRVVGIQANLSPSTYPKTFVNQRLAQDVLELKAGQAERDAIKSGTTLSY